MRLFMVGSMALLLSLLALPGCNIKTTVGDSSSLSLGGDQSNNHQPIITCFTANPTNTSSKGQAITFSIDVVDQDNELLKYNWSANAGTLSTNTGRVVTWTPPEADGAYVVQVSISDQKGGTTEGSQNIIVKMDGTAKVGQ